MASGLLGTAITGLAAFQRSLETTSHNISNVNTDGYSRQRVDLVTKQSQMIGVGFLGKGVEINNISRSYDKFIVTQLRSSTAAFGDVSKFRDLASQIDNILADPSVGMEPAIKKFFNAMNDATNDPSSIPARQVLLSESNILSNRFQTMNGQFVQIRDQLNSDIQVTVNQISSLAQSVADLNLRIANAQGLPNANQQPNDLLDQRDATLNKLAKLIDISVVPGNSGMVSVFLGQGQSLILDGHANTVLAQPSKSDPAKLDIGLKDGAGTVSNITTRVNGGELSGILRFRDNVLDLAQQRLGSIAASISMEFNTIHQKGFDLNGKAGGFFFNEQGMGSSSIPVIGQSTNATGSSLKVMFDPNNISKIDYSDYTLEVGAGPVYTLTRELDKTSITLTASTTTPTQLVASAPDSLPGITIEPTGLQPGDSFLIRPTFSAASAINGNLSDPHQIALATNIATDSAGNPYVVSGAMPGDNRNGLALAGLESKQGMLGGTSTFQEAYGLVVSDVGVLTNAAKVASSAQETLLNNTKNAWNNISGVNLDEEAANLIKFQQSYQAAARVISVSDQLFKSLIGSLN